MSAIEVKKRKTGKSKAIQDAFFCGYEGCNKTAKYEATFLDHYWNKWHLCDDHSKEIKKIIKKVIND